MPGLNLMRSMLRGMCCAPDENVRGAGGTVEGGWIGRHDALVVGAEEGGDVEWPDRDVGRQTPVPQLHLRAVLAGPPERDVGELVLAAQVVDQQLELGLQALDVPGGVVGAAGPRRQAPQLVRLEHLADAHGVELDASFGGDLSERIAGVQAARVAAVGEEDQRPNGARVGPDARKEAGAPGHAVPDARRAVVEAAVGETRDARTDRRAVGGQRRQHAGFDVAVVKLHDADAMRAGKHRQGGVESFQHGVDAGAAVR